MRIAVTGAQGFTGRVYCERARKAGHVIIPIAADLNDEAALGNAMRDAAPDALVHLAAISFVGHADAEAFYKVNVIGTMNVLAAAANLTTRPGKILIASSANIYGNCTHSPIAEETPPAPVNHYAASKLAMEHMARTFGERLPLIIARPFNYTGVGQAPNFVIPKIVDHFRKSLPTIELGNIHVEREFNDVRMIADAYLALLAHGPAGETFNICTGHAHTLQSVIAHLEKLTGHRITIAVNPAFVRANEVHRLCGSPEKLNSFLTATQQTILQPSLTETLAWMVQDTPA